MDDSPFSPAYKLLAHPAHLAHFQSESPDAWKYPPIGVEISPTNSCNAKCPWCFYVSSDYKQHHSEEHLRYELLHGLLWSLANMGVMSVTWTGGGEPSTYPGIDEAILYADDRGLNQGMFTNGYAKIARPDLLDWIRITVTEKFVLTKHVAEYAKVTDVGVNFNVTNQNHKEMRRMVLAAIDAGVRYFQVRPALADTYGQQEHVQFPDWIYQYSGKIRIEVTGYKWRDYRKPHGYNVCHGHRLVPFIWHDGDVAVCAYHKKNHDYTFGNLSTQTFEEIWLGERRQQMIKDGVAVINSCQHCCKLHEINKALTAKPRHSSFV